MEESLQKLLDHKKIHDVLTRYALSVDQHDWERLHSIFTTEIERDLSSFTGNPPETIKSEQHVNECRSTLPGFDSTQHFLLNHDITIKEDRATAQVYMIADHTLVADGAQKQFSIHGIFTYQLIRNANDWNICALALKVQSTQGDQSIFALAAERANTKG